MKLSDLCRNLDEVSERFGDMILAVGAPNGAWKPFGLLRLGTSNGEAVACLSVGAGRHYEHAPTVADIRLQFEDFRLENGDLKVGVMIDDMIHDLLDLNVDQDVDSNGDEVNVAIIQAYLLKPSFRR